MQRRKFNTLALGTAAAVTRGGPGRELDAARPISAERMRRDKKNAATYPKPKGLRNGFDSVDMHEVWVTQQAPAVRVKLEMAGKPQAAQREMRFARRRRRGGRVPDRESRQRHCG